MPISSRTPRAHACLRRMTTQPSVQDAKKALRKSIKERLAQVSEEAVARQSREVTAELLSLPVYKNAHRMSVYLSMPGKEIATKAIVLHALENGKKVFVPYIHKARSESQQRTISVMEMLALHSKEDLEALDPDAWGIPCLHADSVAERENALYGNGEQHTAGSDGNFGLDLVLLPGLAFDRKNGRIGHGKGFYDRFLQRYKDLIASQSDDHPMPELVGLALAQQMTGSDDTVPVSEKDWKVDRVLCGTS